MTTDIKRNNGHWELYINGKLYCTADNYTEAEMELQTYLDGRDVNDT